MRNIGGVLDYRRLAELNKPADPDRLAAEARRLASTGMAPQDIARVLSINVLQVRAMLAATGAEAAAIHQQHGQRGRT